MRLYSRSTGDGTRTAVGLEGTDLLLDLADAVPPAGALSVGEVVQAWPSLADDVRRAHDAALPGHPAVHRLADVDLLAPVGQRRLIVCCGFNYADHEGEVSGSAVGATWFIKNANALAGPRDPVLMPEPGAALDYEGEVVAVIGRTCHRVSVDEALSYVGGYTLANDVSVRLVPAPSMLTSDDIKRSVIDSQLGKQHPTFLPLGPAVVTADEVPDPSALTFTTTVNGDRVQQGRLSDMRMGVAELVAWLSSVFRFEPGDLISTGSPSGTAMSFEPPRFLTDGDQITVSSPAIGELRNGVLAPVQISEVLS